MRLIKRYGNRRLYDMATSSTITQTELAEIVKKETEIKVVEAGSGKDITNAVLGRLMLFETSRWKNEHNQKELFKTIIKAGGEKSMSILKNTFLASVGAIKMSAEKAEKIIDELIKKGELDKSKRKKAIMELLDKADKSTADFRKKVSVEAVKVGKDVSDFAKRMQPAMQEDLKNLESKVDGLAAQLRKIEDALKNLRK
ncbi:MAG: polyhydroxyalkanoate synthesis regulator DNA-binding domain-containing protein [Candidatus Zixiibacteriota bacterium]